MNRRELLQALAGIPLFKIPVKGDVAAVQLAPGKFIVFFNHNAMDIDSLIATPVDPNDPLAGSLVVPIHVRPGHSIQDEIAIYRLDD